MTPEQINAAVEHSRIINALVAEKVAGLQVERDHTAKDQFLVYFTQEAIKKRKARWPSGATPLCVPNYYHSADCVIPLLKEWVADASAPHLGIQVTIWDNSYGRHKATAPTFAAAACLALLKSVGVDVSEAEGI